VIFRTVLAATALMGFGAFASACNDDGSLSLDEYFQQVEEIDKTNTERQGELEGQFDELGPDSSVDDAADLFEQQVDLLRDFHGDLDDIEPPDEAEDAHNRAVEALGEGLETFDSFIEQFREADSIEEAFGQFEDSDFAAFDRADEACRDLVQVATDNGVDVTLDCESEE
jgi:hypothetical protein